MTSRAKRLTLIVGVAALIAAVVGSVMAPDTVAAPKGKPTTDFVIKTTEDHHCDASWGTWKANGAISSSGPLWGSMCPWSVRTLRLWDDHGSMSIKTHPGKPGTFELLDADGAYEGLIGATGSYRYNLTTNFDEAGEPSGTISRTLKGSVPE